MPWYRTGTVAVTLNNNTVTGSGTSFVANSRVGDAFLGPDGGWYEVTNVVSNTVLSIAPNYRSATNAAGTYALTPVQGYTKDLADQVRAMIQQWGSALASLGPLASATVAQLANGGTGATTAPAARTSLGLGTAAVANIGTAVGSVMGVGAGGWLGSSIVESSNANNQRQTGLYSLSGVTNSPFGAGSWQMLSSDWGADPRWQSQLALGVANNRAAMRSIQKDQSASLPWVEFYTTSNTTRSSDGTLKAI